MMSAEKAVKRIAEVISRYDTDEQGYPVNIDHNPDGLDGAFADGVSFGECRLAAQIYKILKEEIA